MRSWQLAVFCLAYVATAGCRTPPAVALLERENRDLEYQLYELADLVDDARRENAKLRERLQQFEADSEGPSGRDAPPKLIGPLRGPARRESDSPAVPNRLRSPDIEMPSEDISGEEFLKRFGERGPSEPRDVPPPSPNQNAPMWVPPPEGEGSPTEPDRGAANDRAVRPRADNAKVAAITLNERLTGGYNLDARPGHEGVFTVIEPRDGQGRLVDAAAPVSVVVLDPALSGEAARVARWDFTAEEIAQRYRKTPLSEGIHLELVWPDAIPVHNRLHLFVRYVTDHGRKLQAEDPIEIEAPTLEARRSAPPPEPPPGSSQAATQWQRSQRQPPAAVQLPASEPARTALVPRRPDSRPANPAAPPSQPDAPQGRPVWSPNRP